MVDDDDNRRLECQNMSLPVYLANNILTGLGACRRMVVGQPFEINDILWFGHP
jgi:hypothetical protein